jgi:hypothetical protein
MSQLNIENLENLPTTLQTVQSRPLFVMRLDVKKPYVFGEAPQGTRRISGISGGIFHGERLNGKILDGGNDWQIIRKDGCATLDVRLTLQTDDGEFIYMTYQGYRHGPKDVIDKIGRGESVNPADYYFRTNPVFETASLKYEWLNRVITVGIGHREASGPIYSIFEIL